MGTHPSWHQVLAAVGVACASIAGCRSDRSKAETQGSSTAQSNSSKAQGLETYCKDEPCRRYEDAVAKLERLAQPGSYCITAETGSCGEFRYVEYSGGYQGYTQYFRASGPMVGARTWSDVEPRRDLGTVPSCKPIVERRLCVTPDSGG